MRNNPSSGLVALTISGLLVLLTGGCGTAAFYDPTATDESVAAQQQSDQERARRDSSVTGSHDDLSLERLRWSKLTKEGRNQLRVGNLGASEQNFVAAAAIASNFRTSDRRRHAGIGNLRRLADAYQSQNQELAFIRVAEVIRAHTRGQSEIEIPGLSKLMLELGRAYINQDSLDEAQAALAEALALRVQREGVDSPALIDIYASMAHSAFMQEDYNTAAEFARERMRLAALSGSESDENVIGAQLQLGQILVSLEEYDEAEVLFSESLEWRRRLGNEPVSVILIQNALAGLYLETDRTSLANSTIEEALKSTKEMELGGILLANLIDTHAQILAARGKTKQADREFQKASELATDAPASQRVQLLENYNDFLKANKRGKESTAIQALIDGLNSDLESRQSHLRKTAAVPNPAATPEWDEAASNTAATP
jgi:tetratricopeptide (TPR) repeat protein